MAKRISASMRVPGIDDSPVVPQSRTLNDPDPANQIDKIEQLRDTHVAGEPFEEWAKFMPDEVVGRMCYALTDEGLAEQQRRDRDRDMRLPSGDRASDPMDKALLERRDFLASDKDPAQAPDRRRKLAERHAQPGMRPKFINPAHVQAGEDPRGWQVVTNGKGEPVRDGTSVLAMMPEADAQARSSSARELDRQLMKQVYATDPGERDAITMRPGQDVISD